MKHILLVLALSGSLAAQELDLADAAKQISAEFRKKNASMDFRSTLAVARFKTSGERLQKNGTADLVKASFEKEFVRSVYFEVVERENLDKVTAEIELRQKGLTQTKSSDDALRGAEHLLVGELAEDAGNLVITARLVQAATGTVVATAQARAPLDSAEQAANIFRYNAFQSQYGITLGVDASLGPASRASGPPPALMSAFVAYRAAKPVRLGTGISYFLAHEYVREEYPNGSGGTGGRNYNLSGVGGRFFADFLLTPHPRWNIGLRADVHFMPGMKLEQDVSNVKAWEISGVNTTTTVDRRVIVNGTSTWGMTIFKPALLFEYLVSKRLSFFFSGGYAFSTIFKPIVYEAGGYRQWDSDADKNGTFTQYQNFNFARRPDGSPVQFQLGYVFIDIGLSLHF